MISPMPAPAEAQLLPAATKLLINGQWIDSESGKTFATTNPATGKEIKIAASKNARFKAGAALKASLNTKKAAKK